MGEDVPVSSVKIYNSDVPPRLSNSLVSLKENQGRTVKSYYIGDATGKAVFEFNRNSFEVDLYEILGFVRYVRVQQDGTAGYLHMREVQVFDQNGVNRARAKTASQSSTNTYNNVQLPASNAVDDELIGVKNFGSMTEYKTGKCQISASIFPWMSCSVL